MHMEATRRMAILVLLGVLPLLAGMLWGVHISIFIIYNLLLAAAFLLDKTLSPEKADFQVERFHERNLEMGRENQVSLQVSNRSRYPVSLEIVDTLPEGALQNPYSPGLFVNCAPGGVAKVSYSLVPEKRGSYSFGSVHLNCRGVLGLVSRRFSYPLQEEIAVYPNLQPLKKYRLRARKDHLLDAEDRAHQVPGVGTDFQGLREYTTDDEFRKINWNATARMHKLITNTYDMEKSQNILLAIDVGRVMMGEAGGMSKLDHAIQAALVLAQVAMDKGDKVGLLVFHHEVKAFIKPDKGKGQMEKILQTLYRLQPEYYESDFREMVAYLGAYQRKRSLVCIFSQLTDEESGKELASVLGLLRERHAVLYVSLLNPGLRKIVDGPDMQLTDIYQKAAAVYRLKTERETSERLLRMGIPNILAEPEGLTPQTVNRYLLMKKQMKV